MKELILNILKHDYETVPFHNFRILLNKDMELESGGTCSDRTLYLKQKLQLKGIKSKLHYATIKGKNIHRLLKIEIDKDPYFLDTGLGWPLIYPISLIRNEFFNFYGLTFKTIIENDKLFLFKSREGEYTISYETTVLDIEEKTIENQIKDRFFNTEQYPFTNSIRFSQIVNNEFYFLKGNILGYSEKSEFKYKTITSLEEFIELFDKIFEFDLDIAVEVAKKLKMFQ
jgi:arylamine N-acetyltransferase